MKSRVKGRVGWLDLTVADADGVRDFYAAVVGWTPEPVSMGDYADYNMLDGSGSPAAGVCHRRGGNADQPAGWIPYFVVPDLDASLATARDVGGEAGEPRRAGDARWAVAKDPSGAAFALWEETD